MMNEKNQEKKYIPIGRCNCIPNNFNSKIILISINYFTSSLIYLCAVNLGGDVNCLMSKELLENTYKDAEHWKWTLNPSTIFYIKADHMQNARRHIEVILASYQNVDF